MCPTAYGIFVASGPAMYAQNLQVIALIIMVEFHTRPDNSSVTDFDSYEPVWYFDEVASFPEPKWKMARCLGEAYDIGQAMCYFILPESGIPIAISTVQQISEDLKATLEVQEELKHLDKKILKKIGETTSSDSDIPDYFHQEGDEDNNPETPQFDPSEEPMPEADDYDHEAFDK